MTPSYQDQIGKEWRIGRKIFTWFGKWEKGNPGEAGCFGKDLRIEKCLQFWSDIAAVWTIKEMIARRSIQRKEYDIFKEKKKKNNKRDLKHEQEKWHFNIREGRLMDDRQLREGGAMENE